MKGELDINILRNTDDIYFLTSIFPKFPLLSKIYKNIKIGKIIYL